MKPKIIILYKDGTYKRIKEKNFNARDHNVETILIPIIGTSNVYFPMKQSSLYEYPIIDVYIEHALMVCDYESDLHEDISANEYSQTCLSLIEFGNALFNLYKFRGMSIMLTDYNGMALESIDSTYPISYTIYPTRIKIDFKDSESHIEYTIDSGFLGSLAKETDKIGDPQYASEYRMACLENLLYIPAAAMYYNVETQIDGLPSFINLTKEKHWKKISNILTLDNSEILLIKNIDIGVYHCTDVFTYNELDDICASNVLVIKILSTYLSNSTDKVLIEKCLPNYNGKKPLNDMDRRRFFEAWIRGDFQIDYPIELELKDPIIFLTVQEFLPIFVSYIKYFEMASYQFETGDGIIPVFVVFGSVGDSISIGRMTLFDSELSEENIDKKLKILLEETSK